MGLLDVRDLSFRLGEGPTTMEAIHRLRYDVYVKEFGFFNSVHHTNGLLPDAFDPFALHAVAVQRDDLAGALRLTLHSERGFPIAGLVPRFRCPSPPESTGEVSHLVIAKRWRRRREDCLYGAEGYLRVSEGGILPDGIPLSEALKKRGGPALLLGLFRILYQSSRRLGLRSWLMLAEKRLHTLLNRYGIPLLQMSDPVGGPEGPRPCLLHLHNMESCLKRLHAPLYAEFLRGLEKEYRP